MHQPPRWQVHRARLSSFRTSNESKTCHSRLADYTENPAGPRCSVGCSEEGVESAGVVGRGNTEKGGEDGGEKDAGAEEDGGEHEGVEHADVAGVALGVGEDNYSYSEKNKNR